ncbi:MAG: PLP-dependent aminotransferase family protein [Ruminococcus sp.]|uniref:aminotransferase-like domain-containing protein n=1 Tax=Ruminococcus sp. TaxID=41978 RepID=UPI00287312E0|nr:PLP-dependent aminotransferase family protein [Ruminococcus sp.]MBQ3284579.1 PLP-dependent aminotransferase family protein [Ruminococcus sp.]
MDYCFSNKVLALKPNAIREILKSASDPDVISLSAGNPAPDAFPVEAIREISERILRENPIGVLQYGVSEGYTPLRDTLKAYLKEKHNIGTDDDELIVVSGAQQVMDLAGKSFLNEGDVLICEAPSFIGSLNTFRSYNAKLVGVTVESDGMDMEELEKALDENPNAKMIYTIPNFQNPSGVTMSLEKRKKLYELAFAHNCLIIEDNPYGDLRYFGEDVPSIKSFDTEGIVIYSGSFSKVISPGIRVGFMCAPKAAMAKMIICKQGQDVHTTMWSQMICNEFLTKYDFEGHLAFLRDLYREKAALCMKLLDEYVVPNGITYNKIEGGLFIWCDLPEDVDMLGFCKKLTERKVCVVPGNAFLTDSDLPCRSFRINFSTPTDEDLTEGIKEIGKLAKETIL